MTILPMAILPMAALPIQAREVKEVLEARAERLERQMESLAEELGAAATREEVERLAGMRG